MNKYERMLHIMGLITKDALSTDNIRQKLFNLDTDLAKKYGLKTLSMDRQINRDMAQFKKYGFTVKKTSYEYQIETDSQFLDAFTSLLKSYFEKDLILKKHIYGDIDRSSLAEIIEIQTNVYKKSIFDAAKYFIDIAIALKEKKNLGFYYAPQHPDTAKKFLMKRKSVADKGFDVAMLCHYLVFRKGSLLLLGEVNHKDKMQIRQYLLKGISKLKISGTQQPRQLKIIPDELYKYSVGCWIGGNEHTIKLKISELADPSQHRFIERTVNGEEEIIKLILDSNGAMRIINPPPEIKDKARQMKVQFESMFADEKKTI
ncbi:MAG: hypothetical protein OEZ13_04335 [Spirochaetia bacterium]|nr:hypothetical protein [Spirochaetia bacterium]